MCRGCVVIATLRIPHMTADPFRPFDTHLDQDAALALVQEATLGADDG